MRQRSEQPAMTLLRRELQKRPLCAYQAADFLAIHVRNARQYFKLLRPEIRVCRWLSRGRGPWVPVWELGDEADAPRPHKQARARRRLRKVTFGKLFK